MSYVSNDGHFSVVYLYGVVTALKSFLGVLYCRVTALDKYMTSQVVACIRWANVPKLTLKVMQTMRGYRIPRNRGTTPEVEMSAPLLF